ncbi:MAG: hypothetical protein LAO77_09115 [Acidobacteriia bacterium]|nr:hypothetical protein [Terriglobia bacterium]
MSSPAILLVDSSATLEAARDAGWLRHRDVTVVAATKYGVHACHAARVPYTVIDSFYPAADLVAFTLAAYDRLSAFCEERDAALWRRHDDLRRRGIRPFRFSFYELKILADVLSVKLLQLRRLFAVRPGTRAIYRAPGSTVDAGAGWPIDERCNLFGALLESNGAGCPAISLEPIAVPCEERLGPAPRGSLEARARRAGRSLVAAIERATSASAAAAFVLFAPGGHDIRYVLPALKRRGLAPVALRRSGRPAAIDRAPYADTWREWVGDEAFARFFSVDGVSYFPLVRARLERLIVEETPAAIDAYDDAAARIEHSRALKFALTAVVTVSAEERSQMKACQDAGLPLVTYQEGAGFGSVVHPMNDYAEIVDGDAFLCYGPGNLEYRDAQAAAGRPAKPFVVVGSAEQDDVRARLRPRATPRTVTSIMYVGTGVAANRQHHPCNGGTDTAYAASQLLLFEALARLSSRVTVRVKPHPSDPLPGWYFDRRTHPRVEMLDGVLEDHLDGTDLFIVDHPSTTLLTCCETAAHVYVLANPAMTRFTDGQRRSLETRAFVFEDAGALVRALDQLAAGAFQMSEIRADDDYVRRYGTYLADGQSAERAAAYLDTLGRAS